MVLRKVYGANAHDIERFVDENECVKRFLGKYEKNGPTYEKYSRGIYMFFAWLHYIKGLELTPIDFLRTLATKRRSEDPQDWSWGKNLVLEFGRDNPDLEDKSDSTKLVSYITPLKRFCAENEVQLCSSSSLVGVVKRKYGEPPFTVDLAKKVLSVFGQRDRAICMVELQSGQSIKQAIEGCNKQSERIMREVMEGKQRIRLDFEERKNNHFRYFSFISTDAITEIRKWLIEREKILEKLRSSVVTTEVEKLKVAEKLLWITNKGDPVTVHHFLCQYTLTLQRHNLWKGPLTVRNHMFRKVFETEASPPDRGIHKAYVKFMMGHSSGTQVVSKLDMPGGPYDNAPSVYSEAVEGEYKKLEPFINVYTGKSSESTMTAKDRELLELLRKPDIQEALKWLADKPFTPP